MQFVACFPQAGTAGGGATPKAATGLNDRKGVREAAGAGAEWRKTLSKKKCRKKSKEIRFPYKIYPAYFHKIEKVVL